MKKQKFNRSFRVFSKKLYLISLSFLFLISLVGCGAKATRNISPLKAKLGPQAIHTKAELQEANHLLEDMLNLSIKAKDKVRGGMYEAQVSKLLTTGRAFLKKKEFSQAISNFEQAYKLAPDESALLLLAAAQHLRLKHQQQSQSKKAKKTKIAQSPNKDFIKTSAIEGSCRQALSAWQRYLSNCSRCETTARYRDRAIINANQLGAQCGAWTLWESEPSRAKLKIDGIRLGRTPLEIWVASGQHHYELKRANLSESGTVILEQGQQKQLRPKLIQTKGHKQFKVTAKLKCMREKSNDAEHKACNHSMKAGDLFTLEIASDQEVYLYLFAKNGQDLAKLYPQQQKGILRSDKPMIFPQANAWQLDDQSQDDQLWLLASDTKILELSKNNAESAQIKSTQWQNYLNAFVEQYQTIEQDQLELSSQNGKIFMRWILRSSNGVSLLRE